MASLNSERIMVAAMCTGILDGVLEDAIAYAKERTAFGKPIGQIQAIQHKIADIAMMRDRPSCSSTAPRLAAAQGGRAAWRRHRQGRGLRTTRSRPPTSASRSSAAWATRRETDMQRYWRDVRLFKIGPITNEMSRNSSPSSLGLPRSF